VLFLCILGGRFGNRGRERIGRNSPAEGDENEEQGEWRSSGFPHVTVRVSRSSSEGNKRTKRTQTTRRTEMTSMGFTPVQYVSCSALVCRTDAGQARWVDQGVRGRQSDLPAGKYGRCEAHVAMTVRESNFRTIGGQARFDSGRQGEQDSPWTIERTQRGFTI
jgi:hypothetical protein